MRLSRELRARFYYSIPVAGSQVGWSRSEAYRAARRGDIPTEKNWAVRTGPAQAMGPRGEALPSRAAIPT